MSSPYQNTRRHSAKLRTPGSVFGVRNTNRDSSGHCPVTIQSERIKFGTSRNESDDLNGLQDLLGKKWYAFKVSPLYHFQNNTTMLRRYSRKLREYLTDMQTDTEEAFHYSVVFSEAPGIAYTEHDADAFKLQVTAVSEENEQNFYVGFMMCRGAERALNAANVIHLPVLFCQGRVKAIQSVHQVLSKCFDCSITPLHITQEELLWFYAIQSESQTLRRNSSVELIFTIPSVTVKKTNLTMKLPVSWLKKLWSTVHKEEDCVQYKEVKKLHQCLGAYLSFSGVNWSNVNLIKIVTPSVTVSHEGYIKVTVLEVMHIVLLFLYEMSTILESERPHLSVHVTR